MKLIVNPHKIEIDKSPVNEREIDITKCEFEFADEITNDYVKEAYFTFNGTTYKQTIVNNECNIPSEVLVEKGQIEIGVVAFKVENQQEIKRYNPSPAYFNTWEGSLKDNVENVDPITPTDKEQIEQALQNVETQINNLDIEAEKTGGVTTLTITKKDGTQQVVQITDGRGIVSITLTSSTDTEDVYTILYTDDTTSTFTIEKDNVLASDTVTLYSLDENIETGLYGSTSDIEKHLGWYLSNYNTNASKISSPMLLKKDSTITISSSFVTNYHWKLYEINRTTGTLTTLFNEVTSTTYTVEKDLYCALGFRPIDNNWDTTTYTVSKDYKPTNTDIQLTTYYPLVDGYNLNDIDGALLKNMWCKGNVTHSSSTTGFYGSSSAIGTAQPFISSYPLRVIVQSGYQIGYTSWKSLNANHNTFINSSGWQNNNFVIPANTYFTLSLRKSDGSNVTFNRDLINKVEIVSYNGDLTSQYYYQGIDLDIREKHFLQSQQLFAGFNPNHDTTLPSNTLQGMDIYNGYIYQMCNNLGIQIIDLASGTQVSFISLPGIDHGDTCQFSNTFYDENDIAPLLYVISNTTPGVVHIVRIQNTTTASIIKNYVLSSDDGYYSGQCFDFENNIMYSFGYKLQDFRNSTGNSTIVAVYDMSKETLIDGINYSLDLIERYERPFIYCVQGQKFLNGMCYFVSSYLTSEQPTRIYAYDPYKKIMVAVFKDLPNEIITTECEDISFVPDGGKYAMIVFTRRYYTKITFL